MGPYYRNTSQGMGSFFDSFYENPLLMLAVVAAISAVGIYLWRKSKTNT
jgi:DUF1365 family protein